MSRRDHPNPSAAPVQKLRLRYAKRGRLRFTSHRDLARAFERAIRRAGVPMAYSQGFSPHPKISWANAVPTGVASEAEYVELQLVREVDPAVLQAELGRVLPPGMDLLEVVQAGPGALADRLEASRWLVELPGVSSDELRTAAESLLAAECVEVQRLTKDGTRTLDARSAVLSAEVLDSADADALSDRFPPFVAQVDDWPKGQEPYGILVTVVRQTTPAVRPDDVLNALRVVADLDLPTAARATRWEQGRLDDAGGLADPFILDRAAVGTHRGQLPTG